MPHIILETTADLHENDAIPDILEGLVNRLSTFETVNSASIKAYHALRPNWRMGEGAQPGFAHVTVAVLQGRPPELRKQISDGMYEELRSHFSMSLEEDEVQLTLELREMDPHTYRK